MGFLTMFAAAYGGLLFWAVIWSCRFDSATNAKPRVSRLHRLPTVFEGKDTA